MFLYTARDQKLDGGKAWGQGYANYTALKNVKYVCCDMLCIFMLYLLASSEYFCYGNRCISLLYYLCVLESLKTIRIPTHLPC